MISRCGGSSGGDGVCSGGSGCGRGGGCDNVLVMLSVVAIILMGAVVVTSGLGVGGSCGNHGVYYGSGCVVMLMPIEAMLVVAW